MFYRIKNEAKKAVLLFSFFFLLVSGSQAQRPNIIYIMTDDMGYGDLSIYGRKDYQTPHLDKLAAQGMKFVNAYAAAPLCTPTRTAFMTGRYPARTPVGLIEPLTGDQDTAMGLTPEFPSLATIMKETGYETALIGKWHLGSQPRHSPTNNGFNYFYGIRGGAADYISHKGVVRTHDLFENDSMVYPQGYLTDLFSQKAISFIQQKHDKPFFLTLTYNAPHWPWQGPGDKPYEDSVGFRQGGSAAVYKSMMKSMDDGIGAVLKALEDAHLAANTIVIFTNDNGGERYSDNGGLTDSKGSLWEGGIRVPAFVRWPGKIKPGLVTQQAAITMDWTATILAAAGARPLPGFALDGKNLLPVLTGRKKSAPRTFYWRASQRVQQKALRKGQWKYLHDERGEYLFNLAMDQGEKKDIKTKQVGIFNRLKQRYAEWEKTVLQPVPFNRSKSE
jgi:arylsulfatase A-like enzyme